MKNLVVCCVFLSWAVFVYTEEVSKAEVTSTEKKLEPANEVVELSIDTFKKLMWKKCSNSSYVVCAKLALVHVIEKLDSSDSYILLPGISLLKKDDGMSDSNFEDVVIRHDFNEALDKYLLKKIKRYLGSLTLSVKLLDTNTIEDMRSFTDVISGSSEAEGRGKKKYMHSLLMAGWMSGATLLALTMKTIAILSGKALLAALLSLMLSVISAFSHKGHADLKSTTYEIITKPIVAHTHQTDAHDGHASEINPAYTFKRSINPAEIVVKSNGPSLPEDVEHVIRKIRERTPYYAPVSIEYSKS